MVGGSAIPVGGIFTASIKYIKKPRKNQQDIVKPRNFKRTTFEESRPPNEIIDEKCINSTLIMGAIEKDRMAWRHKERGLTVIFLRHDCFRAGFVGADNLHLHRELERKPLHEAKNTEINSTYKFEE